jgi:hypothetical protein
VAVASREARGVDSAVLMATAPESTFGVTPMQGGEGDSLDQGVWLLSSSHQRLSLHSPPGREAQGNQPSRHLDRAYITG